MKKEAYGGLADELYQITIYNILFNVVHIIINDVFRFIRKSVTCHIISIFNDCVLAFIYGRYSYRLGESVMNYSGGAGPGTFTLKGGDKHDTEPDYETH